MGSWTNDECFYRCVAFMQKSALSNFFRNVIGDQPSLQRATLCKMMKRKRKMIRVVIVFREAWMENQLVQSLNAARD